MSSAWGGKGKRGIWKTVKKLDISHRERLSKKRMRKERDEEYRNKVSLCEGDRGGNNCTAQKMVRKWKDL